MPPVPLRFPVMSLLQSALASVTPLAAFLLSQPVQAAAPRIALETYATGLSQPLSLSPLPTGGSLIVDQVGVLFLRPPSGGLQPVLSLSNRLSEVYYGRFDERGLIGLALHPQFASNRRLFLSYTAPRRPSAPAQWDCTLRVSEFVIDPTFSRIDPNSEIVRLEIDHPYNNHIGGRIAFGPDGMLYIGTGDGGNQFDEGRRPDSGNGQSLETLLAKILRIDINTPSGHGIPKDNPFLQTPGALPEIWAYGLRNPWSVAFDRGGNHELYVADVGQNLFEEVNIIRPGGNYGWKLREGLHGFDPKAASKIPEVTPTRGARGETLIDPIFQYGHPRPGSQRDPIPALGISITGGYVYRGSAIPSLKGQYVFGDWSKNFGLPQGVLAVATPPASGSTAWSVTPLEIAAPARWAQFVCAFAEDAEGEIYVLTNTSNALTPGNGKVWRIVPAQP